jgi:integrase
MRPKTTGNGLPQRMLRRTKTLKSGKVWAGYYHNGYAPDGSRKETPLGGDYKEALRKWAELECRPAPTETGLMGVVFERYVKDVVPTKAPRTQVENMRAIDNLTDVFGTAPIEAITPQHVAQYRDKRTAKISANREIALFSHCWNMAREWGYTARENPVRGIRKNKESARTFYADKAVWDAVQAHACPELIAAMQLAYLTGQRTADVIKMRLSDIDQDYLQVKQNKTESKNPGKLLRIALTVAGVRTELGHLVDKLTQRPGKTLSFFLLAMPNGQPLTYNMLQNRFELARAAAAQAQTDPAIAVRIRKFQFRDIRAKAASDIDDLQAASHLLGHAGQAITVSTYRRAGQKVNPTR